jgi:hypothetical protein
MTYYEELGISADATDEEIRQAHRRLVKLLHPDQQQDPAIRLMAERQLSRVNRMVAQLLDAPQRRLYDVSIVQPTSKSGIAGVPMLLSGHVTRPLPKWFHEHSRWWKPVALGASLTAMVVMMATSGQTIRSVPVTTAASGPDAVVPVPAPSSKTRSTSTRVRPANTRDSEAEPRPPLPETVMVEPAESPKSDVPEVSKPMLSEPPTATAPTSTKPPQSLVGLWLYAGGGSPSEKEKDLYRPEFIELRIREDDGGTELRGDYRSRYAVTNLAITPSVQFSFRGDAGSGSWRWEGPKGSSGTLTIRFLNPNAIQVDWKVTDLGTSGMGLEFGTATLVRRL